MKRDARRYLRDWMDVHCPGWGRPREMEDKDLHNTIKNFPRDSAENTVAMLGWLDGLVGDGFPCPEGWRSNDWSSLHGVPGAAAALGRAAIRWAGKAGGDLPDWLVELYGGCLGAAGLPPTLDEAREFRKYADTGRSARILMPAALDTSSDVAGGGSVMELVVTACPAEQGRNPVEVAPWSFFALKAKGEHVQVLNDLHASLRVMLADSPAAGEVDKTSFLLDLRPIGTDLLGGGVGIAGAWRFCPGQFEISGPSLGLPLAVAAWASLQGLHPQWAIATGKIDGEGRVLSVGGLVAKGKAISDLLGLKCFRSREVVIFHADAEADQQYLKKGLGDKDHCRGRYKLVGVDCLTDERIRRNATDGFDGHRSRQRQEFCGSQFGQGVPPEWSGAAALDRVAGWLAEGGRCPEKSLALLTGAPGKDPGGSPASPADLAKQPADLAKQIEGWLFHRLSTRPMAHQSESADCPAIVRVPADALVQVGGGQSREGLVAAVRREANRGRPAPLCDDEHVRGAMRKEAKLVLVVFDQPSADFWVAGGPAEEAESRARAACELAAGCHPWARQFVVYVCCDLHQLDVVLGAAEEPGRGDRVALSRGLAVVFHRRG